MPCYDSPSHVQYTSAAIPAPNSAHCGLIVLAADFFVVVADEVLCVVPVPVVVAVVAVAVAAAFFALYNDRGGVAWENGKCISWSKPRARNTTPTSVREWLCARET
jgi:hypothetical protein